MSTRTKTSYRVVLNDEEFTTKAEAKGWTNNAKAADALGITPSALHKIRSRKTEPTAVTIDRILTELDLPFHTLFIREERSND